MYLKARMNMSDDRKALMSISGDLSALMNISEDPACRKALMNMSFWFITDRPNRINCPKIDKKFSFLLIIIGTIFILRKGKGWVGGIHCCWTCPLNLWGKTLRISYNVIAL